MPTRKAASWRGLFLAVAIVAIVAISLLMLGSFQQSASAGTGDLPQVPKEPASLGDLVPDSPHDDLLTCESASIASWSTERATYEIGRQFELTPMVNGCALINGSARLGAKVTFAEGKARSSTADPLSSVASPQSPAAAQAVISWEHDQIGPEVAYGSGPNQYLVVWEDHHWADGAARDIYGRRMSTGGAGVGSAFGISWEGVDKLVPDVAYNSVRQDYLVVFEYAYSATDHDIYGRLVNSDGTLGSEFSIATPSAYDMNPIVAYSSAQDTYLVVWERRIGDPEFGQKDIYARVVNHDGTLPGSEIALDTGSASQEHPAIAYNSSGWDEYLVVWQDKQAGNWDIMGRRVDSDGDLLGGEISIEAPGHDQTWPDIAYNSRQTEYLVVWQDQIGGATSNWDIKSWRRDIAGNAINWYLISDAGTQRRMKPAVTYKYNADEYLVVYEYEYSASDLDLKQSRLRWDGLVRQTDSTVSNAFNIHEARPAVASDGAWSNLIVWEDQRNAPGMGIDIYSDVEPVYAFQGTVYRGNYPDTGSILSGVEVGLWCSSNPTDWGPYQEGTDTDGSGDYTLVVHGSCEYYNIGEYTPSGYVSTGASSTGGTVIDWERIQYSGSLAGQTLTGNNFWDAPAPPPAPTGVSATDGTYTDRVRVTWNPASGASYYEVHRAPSSGGTKSLVGTLTATTLDDTSAVAGTTYYYWVKACNAWSCSDFSAYNTGYRAGEAPDPPTGVSATDGTYTDRVQVSWSSASGATYYQVYRAASSSGAKLLLGSPSGSPYNDTGADVGTTYYYWVTACNSWDCSGYSGYDTGYRAGEAPPVPTGVVATDGTYTDRVQVAWNAASGATYYQVWRAASSTGTKTLLSSPSASPYDDTGALVGTTYYYFVRACNDWDCSGYSGYDTGYRSGEAPDPPTGVFATDGTYADRVQVGWSASSGATYYEVYRAASSGGAKTLLGSPSGSPHNDTSASVGTTYYYWVKACNSWDCSGFSGYDTGYRSGEAPPAPTGVSATDGTHTDKVRVTWSAASGATYYEVYRSELAGGEKEHWGSPTGTSFDDTSAVVGTTYYYWVKACNSWDCSDYSDYDTGYRSGTPPPAPTGVAASDGTYTDRVEVTWSASSGATYYEVYRAETAGGDKTLIGSPSASPFDDTIGEVGTTYYYWVKACNSWDCSGFGSYDTGYRAGEPPDPPAGVVATDGTYTDRVEVSWSASSGATYYEVYRAETESGAKTLVGSPAGSPFDDTIGDVGTTYYYWVKACNSWDCSGFSSYDTGYRAGEPPPVPAGVAATDGTYTDRVEVTWSASSGATYYEVYRAETAGGDKTLIGSPSASPFDDTIGDVGATYYYWAKACNSWDCSGFSSHDTGYRAGEPPPVPAGVAATDGDHTDRVEVTWSSAAGATYYEVYRAETESGSKVLMGSPSASPFDDTIGEVGTTYYYWLAACNTWGCSDFSVYDTGYRSEMSSTGAVSGRVILERRASNAGAVIEVAGQSAVTASDGTYLVTGVPAGAQTVTVRRDGFLRTWREVSVLSDQTLALPDVTLLGGDVNGDDLIGQLDAGEIGLAWNTTPGDAHWNESADITGDGAINVLDMVAVQYNWGREAPGPWPDTSLMAVGPR